MTMADAKRGTVTCVSVAHDDDCPMSGPFGQRCKCDPVVSWIDANGKPMEVELRIRWGEDGVTD